MEREEQSRAYFERYSPVAHSKTHRVPDQDDGNHSISAQIFVRINAVAHRELTPNSDRGTHNSHSEDKSKPMDFMSGPKSPK